mgnify:CR=1 FL=1
MEVGEEDHPELAKLIPHLEQVQYSGEKVTICESGINPADFLPKGGENKKFWNYLGSLTTPPLLESVIWIVFQKPIKVSEKQVSATHTHGSYEWIIMLEKCGPLDLTVFHLISVIGTYGN